MTFNFKKMPDDATDFFGRSVQAALARFYKGAADRLITAFLQQRAPSDAERRRLNFDKHHRLVAELDRQNGTKEVHVPLYRQVGGWSRSRYRDIPGCSTEGEQARRRRQMAKIPTGRRARKRAKLAAKEGA